MRAPPPVRHSTPAAAAPQRTLRRVGIGCRPLGTARAATRDCWLTALAAVDPQAPSGAGWSGRRAPSGNPSSILRQSLGCCLVNSGTLTMRRHSGQGARLPASSAPNCTWASQKGQVKSILRVSTGASCLGSSANNAAAAVSTSTAGAAGIDGFGAAEELGIGTVNGVLQLRQEPFLPARLSATVSDRLQLGQMKVMDMVGTVRDWKFSRQSHCTTRLALVATTDCFDVLAQPAEPGASATG